MATESRPPNVEIARRNLQHVGARVVEVDDHADLLFPATAWPTVRHVDRGRRWLMLRAA